MMQLINWLGKYVVEINWLVQWRGFAVIMMDFPARIFLEWQQTAIQVCSEPWGWLFNCLV